MMIKELIWMPWPRNMLTQCSGGDTALLAAWFFIYSHFLVKLVFGKGSPLPT